jgi:cytoskeleton protein RodZ
MASIGQTLREEREARNISIEEIASATKIVPRYLDALEADRLDQMPGGFFIRGIIRTYAKSIGLDPEEVLNRYKEAGLIEAAAPERKIFPKFAPKASPRPEPAETVTPVVPAEPAPAIEPAPAAEPEAPPDLEKASPSVHFEEAPKPRLSEAARKRILAWTWRGLAAVLLVAVIIIVWPSRHPKAGEPQPGTNAAVAMVPPPPTTAPGTTPSSATAAPTGSTGLSAPRSETATAPATQAEPASPEPAPAAEKVWQGLTIEITFQAETWIQVRTDGELKINGLFPPGSSARAQADEHLLIHTGNAGGFTFRLNGQPAKPLGRSGQVLTDIRITLENIKDFLESPSSGLPTG